MQIYAIKMNNFMRFRTRNNTIVFDLNDEQKHAVRNGSMSMDEIYEQVRRNPVAHINRVKERGIQKRIGIAGMTDGNFDQSNGTGKSSVLEGICYAHYDRIIRKNVNTNKTEKAGLSVVTTINGEYPKNLKESYVEEIFEEGGKVYRIKRGHSFSKTHKTRSPILEFERYDEHGTNVLEGHRKGDAEAEVMLASVVTTDFDVFVNGQMFGQNDAGKFLIGTDKTRKEMLIRLLKLEDIVNLCLKKTRERKNSTARDVSAFKAKVELIEDMLTKFITVYVDGVDGYDDSDLKKAVSVVKAKLTTAREAMAVCDKEVASIDGRLKEFENSKFVIARDSVKEELRKVQSDRSMAIQDLNNQVKQLDDEQKTFKESIGEYNTAIAKTSAKIKDLDGRIATSKAKTFGEQIDKAISVLKEAKDSEGKVDGAKEKLEVLKCSEKELSTKITELSTLCQPLQKTILQMESQISGKGEEIFKCDWCGQDATKQHVEKELVKKKDELFDLQESLKRNKDKHENVEYQIDECSQKFLHLRKIIDMRSNAQAVLDIRDRELKAIEEYMSEQEKLQKEIVEIEERIAAIVVRGKKNKVSIDNLHKQMSDKTKTFDKRESELQKEIIEANRAIDLEKREVFDLRNKRDSVEHKRTQIKISGAAISQELKTAKDQFAMLSYTHKQLSDKSKELARIKVLEDAFGLDGIQTRVIARYLPLLNVYIKEFLDSLTGGRISVRVVINEKSEIDVIIAGATADMYNMNSGGEQNVIRLGVDIGLALLSFRRLGQKPDIICLDEIFGSLDDEHTEAVFEMLDQLDDRFSRVILISHKSEIQAMIEDNIVIERTGGLTGGSAIRYIGPIPGKGF